MSPRWIVLEEGLKAKGGELHLGEVSHLKPRDKVEVVCEILVHLYSAMGWLYISWSKGLFGRAKEGWVAYLAMSILLKWLLGSMKFGTNPHGSIKFGVQTVDFIVLGSFEFFPQRSTYWWGI